MSSQIAIDFTTQSPINQLKLTGQNKLVYEILSSGKTLTTFQAQEYGITALNSRVSDLRNKCKIEVHGKMITTNGGSKVMEYSIKK
jgi:hypothetical protein